MPILAFGSVSYSPLGVVLVAVLRALPYAAMLTSTMKMLDGTDDGET